MKEEAEIILEAEKDMGNGLAQAVIDFGPAFYLPAGGRRH
jgi:hypothetical protein